MYEVSTTLTSGLACAQAWRDGRLDVTSAAVEEVGLERLDPLEEVGLSIVQLVDSCIHLAFRIKDGVDLGWPGRAQEAVQVPRWALGVGNGWWTPPHPR